MRTKKQAGWLLLLWSVGAFPVAYLTGDDLIIPYGLLAVPMLLKLQE